MTIAVDRLLFVAYVVTCIVLCSNLLFLWAYSGSVRAGTKLVVNPEDAAVFKFTLADIDPPAVARVLRAHRNAQAIIFPFTLLALLYVLAGGSARVGIPILVVFAGARLAHSMAYLRAKQPGRTIAFVVSGVALTALAAALVWVLVVGPTAHAG
jgi:microsomal prostaglandin-E synthase 1